VFIDGFVHQLPDVDPQETGEWLDSLDSVIDVGGRSRARYLLARLMERAREQGVGVPAMVSTDYINTIPPEQEPWFPGDEVLERRIRAYIRWNAMAMVDRSNFRFDALGGHLSTFASAAGLYDVGFNHFFRGKRDGGAGDQIFFQGHAAPGIYARAFLEGRARDDCADAEASRSTDSRAPCDRRSDRCCDARRRSARPLAARHASTSRRRRRRRRRASPSSRRSTPRSCAAPS
jgi:pyruvate dehydrogenase E1 component